MTQVEVTKQYGYAVYENQDVRVRKQYAYAVYFSVSSVEVNQLNKQVLDAPTSDLNVSHLHKQILYQITPPRPYKLSGVSTMFGNLDLVLSGIEFPILWDYVAYQGEFNTSVSENLAEAAPGTITTSGVNLTSDGGGYQGEAVQRSGSGAVVRVNSNADQWYPDGSDFCLEGYAYAESVADNPAIMAANSPGSGVVMRLDLSDGRLRFLWNAAGTEGNVSFTDTELFPLNEWVYWCIDKKGLSLKVYRAFENDAIATVIGSGEAWDGERPSTQFHFVSNNSAMPQVAANWLNQTDHYRKADGIRYTFKSRYNAVDSFNKPSLPYPIGELSPPKPYPLQKLALHFDAAEGAYKDLSTQELCEDGDPVARWKNENPDRSDAIQTDLARRPIFKTGGINGHPYLRCQHSLQQFFEDITEIKQNSALTSNSYRTYVAVVANVKAENFPTVFGGSGTNAGKHGLYFRPVSGGQVHPIVANARFGNLLPVMAIVFQHEHTYVQRLRYNDVLYTHSSSTGAPTGQENALQLLRATGLGSGGYFDGDVYELFVYQGRLSNAQADALSAYLMEKYDIFDTVTTNALGSTSAAWEDYTVRQNIKPGAWSGHNGKNRVRFGFGANEAHPFAASKVTFAKRGTGEWDFASAPQELLFNGASGFSIGPGDTIYCDEIDYELDDDEIVIAFHVSATAPSRPGFSNTNYGSNYTRRYRSGGDDTESLTLTGYSDSGNSSTFIAGIIAKESVGESS